MEDYENKIRFLQLKLREQRELRHRDLSDWKITRNELLLAVRTANEFEQMSEEKLVETEQEVKKLKQTVGDLEAQLEKLKGKFTV